MHSILPLRGAIQHYAWGSRTALAEYLGRPTPSERPEAELWLGAHPNGPAEVEVDGRWLRLDRWLERELGTALPFLLKVLAIARPLSMQVHPDAEQARAGFEREQEAGLPPAARRYADPFAKPELVCALTPFAALCGFRPPGEVGERLAALGAAELVPAPGPDEIRLAAFLRGWLARGPASRRSVLARVRESARARAAVDSACAWLLRLDDAYPDDPGILAPLFLNAVELSPGDALYLPPGELHCYLEGVAVEVMGASDNVLRGGLTPKVVDVDELLRIVRCAPRRPPRLRPMPRRPGEAVYATPADSFELALLEVDANRPLEIGPGPHVEILWCAEGCMQIAPRHPGAALARRRGESALVLPAADGYRIEGAGRLYRAAPPRALANAST